MKAVSSFEIKKPLVALSLLVFSSQIYAVCDRDDVSFYLDKGFTTDQITVLCSKPSEAAVIKPDAQNQSQTAMDDNTLYLQRAIKARDIDLNNTTLKYTQEVCIEYGEEDIFGFTPKVCPDVTYIISLKGLEVLDIGKKYGFYGTQEVRIKSEIQREIIGELKYQKSEDRELILDKFDGGNKTAIPVRDDFSLEKVKQILLEISK